MNGAIRNHTTRALWVVETDTGHPLAHRLAPGHRSPSGLDADGFRAVDGTPVDGHTGWIKIVDLSTADVRDADNGTLTRGCFACFDVNEDEFGHVAFLDDGGWGEPL